jgi:predicted transcriptional regulator
MSTSTIVALTEAVLETIESEPMGAPSSSLYLALQHINIDLSTYQLYMSSLERLSLLRKSHDCYHITQKGREWLAAHNPALRAEKASLPTELPRCPAV